MKPLPAGKAADMAGVCTKTLKRMLRDGEIPAYRTLGGHWRVDPRDIDAWKDRQNPHNHAKQKARDILSTLSL